MSHLVVDAAAASWADEVCDRFERAWRSGASPRIEDYLGTAEGSLRTHLLRELLLAELELRRAGGQQLRAAEYLARFPADATLIHGVFGEVVPTLFAAPSLSTSVAEQTAEPAAASPAAQRFGDYDLIEELGHGGMGVVFLARQRSADRMVALKLIRRDYLAQLSDKWRDEMMQRFRTEVRAAASVEHDHIVTVYEVGEVDGQPFFSMQYVPGTSLREILANGPLESRVAAKYLMPVARAIHSAHQQGVLHRDLKPGNLLIDSRSDRALVADFGLAKLLEADTDVTKAGVTLGSPPYMSPEQARDASHVTKAADVYSLGATLYHMLTGRPPLHAATVAETLCQVLQREPALPHELNAAVDRDLEAVCMKCLEKESARRYASADELADELERYLNGQPVRARPIGHLGRLWRWCRNNRLTASLVLAFITILAIAAVVATAGFIRASAAYQREAAQRRLTEQNFRLARQAVERTVELVTEEPLMKSRGLERLRRSQLKAARDFYDKFVELDRDDPELSADRGRAYWQLASINEEMGETQEALAAYDEALKIRQGLVSKYPADPEYRSDLAETYAGLGDLYVKRGRLEKAESMIRTALDLRTRLAQAFPDRAAVLQDLGQSQAALGAWYRNRKQLPEALTCFREEFTIRRQLADKQPDADDLQKELAESHANLARLHMEMGSWQEAETGYTAAVGISQRLATKNPREPESQQALAVSCNNLAHMYLQTDRLAEAEPMFQKAQEIMARLADEHHDVPRYRSNLATGFNSLAEICKRTGRVKEAEEYLQRTLATCRQLTVEFVDIPEHYSDLASGHHNLAILYGENGRTEEAIKEEQTSREIFQRLADDYPQVPDYLASLALSFANLSSLRAEAERYAEAEKDSEQALQIRQRLVRDYPDVPDYQTDLATNRVSLGILYASTGRLQAAEKPFQEALSAFQTLAQRYPAVPAHRRQQALVHRNLGLLYTRLKRTDEAVKEAKQSVALLKPLAESSPRLVEHRRDLATAYSDLASLGLQHLSSSQWEEATGVWSELAQDERDAQRFVEAARFLARATEAAGRAPDLESAEASRRGEAYAAQAVQHLRAAQAAGWFDGADAVQLLLDDPDFAPLRNREDFKSLLEAEEWGAKKKD